MWPSCWLLASTSTFCSIYPPIHRLLLLHFPIHYLYVTSSLNHFKRRICDILLFFFFSFSLSSFHYIPFSINMNQASRGSRAVFGKKATLSNYSSLALIPSTLFYDSGKHSF